MRYQKTVDIWANRDSVASLQRGQWVSAGPALDDRTNVGQYFGVTKSGSIVVGWLGNARKGGKGYYREYMQANLNFAKGRA